jgi:hypothetical protein
MTENAGRVERASGATAGDASDGVAVTERDGTPERAEASAVRAGFAAPSAVGTASGSQ